MDLWMYGWCMEHWRFKLREDSAVLDPSNLVASPNAASAGAEEIRGLTVERLYRGCGSFRTVSVNSMNCDSRAWRQAGKMAFAATEFCLHQFLCLSTFRIFYIDPSVHFCCWFFEGRDTWGCRISRKRRGWRGRKPKSKEVFEVPRMRHRTSGRLDCRLLRHVKRNINVECQWVQKVLDTSRSPSFFCFLSML